MRDSERMRAAAHDLNNLLTIIMGNCELAQRASDKGDTVKATVDLGKVREVPSDCCEILRKTFFMAAPAQES